MLTGTIQRIAVWVCILTVPSLARAAIPQVSTHANNWKANRELARNGKISFRSYTRAEDLPRLSEQELETEVGKAITAPLEESFRGIVDYTKGEVKDASFFSSTLAVRTFYFDAERRTRTDSYKGTKVNDGLMNVRRDFIDPARTRQQITIGEQIAGSTWSETFDSFSYNPNPKFLGNLRPVRETATHYIYSPSNPLKSVWIQKDSGDITKVVLDWGTGIKQVHHQLAFDEFDGVRLPRLGVEATFQKDVLSFVAIRCVENAQFNVELDPQLFEVHARKGDTILDLRNGYRHASFAPADGNAPDIVGLGAISHPLPVEHGSIRRYGLWLTAALVLLLVLAVARKRFPKRGV